MMRVIGITVAALGASVIVALFIGALIGGGRR